MKVSEVLPFKEIIERLECTLGSESDIFLLLEVISPEQYKELRASVIKAFDVNIDTPYTGDVGAELEFGDVSDAVREVTYQRYPEVDDINMPVSLKDRVSWCEAIISVMDDSAATYA